MTERLASASMAAVRQDRPQAEARTVDPDLIDHVRALVAQHGCTALYDAIREINSEIED